MRVLVITRPLHPVPPQAMPGIMEAFAAWRDRYRDNMESFDFFVGGGGCGILNFPDELSLHRCWLEFPFGFFDTNEFYPLVPGDAALAQLSGAVAAMAQQAPQ